MSGASMTVGKLVEAINADTTVTAKTGLWVRLRGEFCQVTSFEVDFEHDFIIHVDPE